MPSELARILRDQKAKIAEQLISAESGSSRNAERQAMALAKVDGLIGMVQQSPEILTQTLREIIQGHMQSRESIDQLRADIEHEYAAAAVAVREAFPEAETPLATLAQLIDLATTRSNVVINTVRDELLHQLQETTSDRQMLRSALQELSTPIIPLYSGILVLPLVGQIDAGRAQDVTEQLLEAIAREQADIVLLDVTGISTLDTSVANHLMQTARAVSLLGSQVILVGISAEIAQTLVTLNVDLGDLVTLSDLQSGVEYALAQLGLAIRPSGSA